MSGEGSWNTVKVICAWEKRQVRQGRFHTARRKRSGNRVSSNPCAMTSRIRRDGTLPPHSRSDRKLRFMPGCTATSVCVHPRSKRSFRSFRPFATTNMQAICGYGDMGGAMMGWLLTAAALAVVFVLGNYR